jgi:FMN phosphatase YigB (HAD superfamily)
LSSDIDTGTKMSLKHTASKVVVLDLGNVLLKIDFLRVFENSRVDLESAKSKLLKMFHTSFFHDYEKGKISTEEFLRDFNLFWDWDLSSDEFERRWNNIFIDLIPETANFLKEYSSKVPIFAYSNTNIVHQRYFERTYKDAMSGFKKVFASNDIVFRKPDREGYDSVASTIGCKGSDIVFLDDLTQNVEGARDANWNAFLFEEPVKSINFVLNYLSK